MDAKLGVQGVSVGAEASCTSGGSCTFAGTEGVTVGSYVAGTTDKTTCTAAGCSPPTSETVVGAQTAPGVTVTAEAVRWTDISNTLKAVLGLENTIVAGATPAPESAPGPQTPIPSPTPNMFPVGIPHVGPGPIPNIGPGPLPNFGPGVIPAP